MDVVAIQRKADLRDRRRKHVDTVRDEHASRGRQWNAAKRATGAAHLGGDPAGAARKGAEAVAKVGRLARRRQLGDLFLRGESKVRRGQ